MLFVLLRRVRSGVEGVSKAHLSVFWWSSVVKFGGFILQNVVRLPLPSSENKGSKVGFLPQLSAFCVSFLVHF